MNRDIYHNLSVAQSLKAQEMTTTGDGAGVALAGYESCMVVLSAGTLGGTTPSFTFKIQDSPDDSTYTDVAAGFILGASGETGTIVIDDAAEDDQIYTRGYIGVQPFIRVIASAVTGTSPTLFVDASIVRGNPRNAPV